MREMNCERALIAKMAEADGETIEDLTEATLHVNGCEACRNELAIMGEIDARFAGLDRLEHEVDLWPGIEHRIAGGRHSRIQWLSFAIVAAALFTYKLFEMLPARDPGPALRLVPLAVIAVLFVVIKENPLKVNPDLVFER